MLGTVVYWVVLLFFITAATQTLGLQTFTDWLARLLDHLPTLAAGLLIVVAGYVLSGFVGDLVQATATGMAPPQREALARVAQGATLVVALLVGADQIGLKVTWIAILAAVLVASVMGGVTIAVSLGARGYVANLIGAHYLRQALRAGPARARGRPRRAHRRRHRHLAGARNRRRPRHAARAASTTTRRSCSFARDEAA